jgi:DNA-binding CsgD family transcriptional regulator
MPASPIDPHTATPSELRDRIHADRDGDPYLVYRDGDGEQRIITLAGDAERLTVGRAPGCEVELAWDGKVSGAHAQLERIGSGGWTMIDDGLSRNGSFVNGDRLRSRHRLADGDLLRFGDTTILFRAPIGAIGETIAVTGESEEIHLSPAQRRVLVALCRPFADGGDFAQPASNQEIADELVVSVDAVKTHLRALFEKFSIGELARSAKRAELVKRAFQSGTIAQRDLQG